MEIDPGDVLDEARRAFDKKDYQLALEKYQWFYENALSIDEAYYGVRLSYCLGEWARLAQEYPNALETLTALKERTLSDFKKSHSRQTFHEYASICEYLGCPDEVFENFRAFHETDKDLSFKLFPFVYEYCATRGWWDICREYLGNGYDRYRQSLETFDYMREVAVEKNGDTQDSILTDAKMMFERDILWILNMLSHIDAPNEYESAISRIKSDLIEREHEEFFRIICAKLPGKRMQTDAGKPRR